MKTLVLLSAFVLLAFLAQADPLPEAAEGAKNEKQPRVEDQDVSISFGQDSVLRNAAARRVSCVCRKNGCRRSEQLSGLCNKGPVRSSFCCR